MLLWKVSEIQKEDDRVVGSIVKGSDARRRKAKGTRKINKKSACVQ